MRSAALVQLVNSALETLRRKEMAPLWHRLAEKKQMLTLKKPVTFPLPSRPGKRPWRQRSTPSQRRKRQVAYM